MAKRNSPRGNYYKDRANREAEEEFFDAPAEYRNNAKAAAAESGKTVFEGEESTSSKGKVATVILVGLVVILGLLVSAYYLLAANSKVPEIGDIMTSTTTAAPATTEEETLPEEVTALEDGTLPGESARIVVNGTTVGNTSNASGGSVRRTTVTASATNAYVNNNSNITSSQIMAMINRSAASKGDVLIWDNVLQEDSDLDQYNFSYQAAYYRVTSENEDIHAIQKNTVYTFLTATNKDASKNDSGMLVLRSENVYNRNGLLVSEYTEGELDSYSDASSFISSYMSSKSGFTRVNS